MHTPWQMNAPILPQATASLRSEPAILPSKACATALRLCHTCPRCPWSSHPLMSLFDQPSSLSSRLAALIERLGLSSRAPRLILERASRLHLPFNAMPATRDSICWLEGPPLQRLVELPRGALSGPVQEDKAQAHAVLIQIVEVQQQQLASFDLRLIDGLSNCDPEQIHCTSFEDYAASAACRQVRIISYKDFVKTISLALPSFLAGERISLRQASWHGERMFWAEIG